MTDALLMLQGAVNTRLRTTAAVTNLVSTRIYDFVPQDVTFPYVEIGDGQEIDDRIDDVDSVRLSITLHIWSRAVGKPQASQIADAVLTALHNQTLTLDANWRMSTPLRRDQRQTLADPDGLTTHVVMNFTCAADPLT
jgi:hypothetical protein